MKARATNVQAPAPRGYAPEWTVLDRTEEIDINDIGGSKA